MGPRSLSRKSAPDGHRRVLSKCVGWTMFAGCALGLEDQFHAGSHWWARIHRRVLFSLGVRQPEAEAVLFCFRFVSQLRDNHRAEDLNGHRRTLKKNLYQANPHVVVQMSSHPVVSCSKPEFTG